MIHVNEYKQYASAGKDSLLCLIKLFNYLPDYPDKGRIQKEFDNSIWD